jgi:stage II sporulation protein AA (anti-sigma F factor antagonist)
MAGRLQIAKREDVFVIRFLDQKLAGDLPNQLGGELSEAAQGDRPKILLSFFGVSFMASDMLGKVMALNKLVRQREGRLVLCDLCPSISEVLKVTKVDTLLAIKATEAEGLAALG